MILTIRWKTSKRHCNFWCIFGNIIKFDDIWIIFIALWLCSIKIIGMTFILYYRTPTFTCTACRSSTTTATTSTEYINFCICKIWLEYMCLITCCCCKKCSLNRKSTRLTCSNIVPNITICTYTCCWWSTFNITSTMNNLKCITIYSFWLIPKITITIWNIWIGSLCANKFSTMCITRSTNTNICGSGIFGDCNGWIASIICKSYWNITSTYSTRTKLCTILI